MDFIVSFALVLAMLLLGEWVSTKTKAWIPSVFITGMLFVIGFWTVMPKDIVVKASFGPHSPPSASCFCWFIWECS